MSSELGCVTPVMIAPAAFTPAELLAQVRDVAVAVASNNGCNCNSHKVHRRTSVGCCVVPCHGRECEG